MDVGFASPPSVASVVVVAVPCRPPRAGGARHLAGIPIVRAQRELRARRLLPAAGSRGPIQLRSGHGSRADLRRHLRLRLLRLLPQLRLRLRSRLARRAPRA